MRTGCGSCSASLIASLALVALLLAVPALAQDCPELVGSLPGGGQTTDLAVSGDYAYLSDSYSGLRVIDVSDPSAPVPVWGPSAPVEVSARLWFRWEGVAVSEGYAYMVLWGWAGYEIFSELEVIDVSTPAAPVWMGLLGWVPGGHSNVAVAGAYAYVADYYGLRVTDVRTPSEPVEVGFVDTPGNGWGVAVTGDYAYVADGGAGLRVIDVTTPALPFEVGFLETPGNALGVAVAGGYAYVADGEAGLRVIDVSTASAPLEVGFLGTPMPAWDVAVSRGYAYVTVGDDYSGGLYVIDVSTPSVPVEVGSYDLGGGLIFGGIAVSDGYVFVGADDAGLYVFRECAMFSDGFESGDASAWSATVP